MGPKKAKKGKAPKKGTGDEDEINQADMQIVLKAQVDSLKQRLVLEQEVRDKSKSKEEEIRLHEREMNEELDKHQDKTNDIVE